VGSYTDPPRFSLTWRPVSSSATSRASGSYLLGRQRTGQGLRLTARSRLSALRGLGAELPSPRHRRGHQIDRNVSNGHRDRGRRFSGPFRQSPRQSAYLTAGASCGTGTAGRLAEPAHDVSETVELAENPGGAPEVARVRPICGEGVASDQVLGLLATSRSSAGIGSGHGLLMVPPLVMVRFDVSWQLGGMSCCAGFVLS
jgi:hypothetical protein